MRTIFLLAAALLSGCASDDSFLLRPLPAATEPSTEVTVIRPRATVHAEWPVYIVVADQPFFDLRNGENTRFRMSSGRQVLTIRCGGGTTSKPVETRIEQDLPPRGSAYFVVEPKFECVSVKPVNAAEAVTNLKTTRFRPVGEVNRMAQSTGEAPAVFTSQPAAAVAATAAATSASSNQRVAAATVAWVEAFNSRDVARIASLYDSDAVLRDTSGQRLAAGPGAIADYLAKTKSPGTVSGGEQEIRVFGETAVDSGTNTLGRYNIVYRNRDGKWLIVDHNTSALQR